MLLFLAGIFALSVLSVWVWTKVNKKIVGIDINKLAQPKITESAGVALLAPFWAAIIYFEFFKLQSFSIELLAFGLMVSGFALIGFLDDTKHKWNSKVMPWMTRALPIAVISLAFAWVSSESILWFIPIALFIAGLASFQNTFAGLNGWQGGSGFIIALAVGLFLLASGPLQTLAFAVAAIILGFLAWNKYPSKVLEGDSGTLLIGSATAGLLALNGKIGLIAFSLLFYLPHLIDFFLLKMLTNRKDLSQHKIRPYKVLQDERLAIPDYPDGKTRYDFAKLVLKIFGPLKEWQIVAIIWLIVALNALFWIFAFGLLKI